MLTVGSLFSGIGGFDLGFERAGMRTVWFCEQDEFCQRVLAKHWPGVPCHSDVRALVADTDSERFGVQRNGTSQGVYRLGGAGGEGTEVVPVPVPYVDVLCGGFPCQDISVAGRGEGIDGARSGLWAEYARLIRDLRPRYVVVENVSALLARGMERVLGDLAACGYDAEWDCIPASAVGAPHRRDRVWLVAYPNGSGFQGRAIQGGERAEVSGPRDRGALADAEGEPVGAGLREDGPRGLGWGRPSDGGGSGGWWGVEPDVGRVVARISPWLDGGRVDAATQSQGTHQVLHALRGADGAPSVLRWTARGHGGVQATEVLLAALCEPAGPPEALGDLSLQGATASPVVVRSVWVNGQVACPSCRRASAEQRREQHPDALRVLPRLLACDCQAVRLDDSGTATAAQRRVDRLRSLGNALVPQIAEWLGRRIVEYEEGRLAA